MLKVLEESTSHERSEPRHIHHEYMIDEAEE